MDQREITEAQLSWRFFEERDISLIDDWSSLVFVRVIPDPIEKTEDESAETTAKRKAQHIPIGYVFITQSDHPDPKVKCPGGHKKLGHTPLDTAKDELLGECYILPDDCAIEYAGQEWRTRPSLHWKIWFIATVPLSKIKGMCHYHFENEGEIPAFYDLKEFQELVGSSKFLSDHYRMLKELGLITW